MTALDLPTAGVPPRGRFRAGITRRASGVWNFTRRKPLGALGALMVIGFFAVALFSPLFVPYHPKTYHDFPLLGPSFPWQNTGLDVHWLGTDGQGRDVLSRVLVGSQISLAIGFSVTLIYAVLGTLLGLLAGYYQGAVDYVIQRTGEIWQAFPYLVALLLIVAIFGPPQTSGGTGPFSLFTIGWDMRNLVFAFSIGAVFGGSRIIRGATLSLKQTDYVQAARALGAGDLRIMWSHVLPNALPFVIVQATVILGVVILAEATLSFLGLGVAPGTPSWGQDLSGRNRQFMFETPLMVIAPGVAISITVLGFNLFGDALRDILDPRLRGSQ